MYTCLIVYRVETVKKEKEILQRELQRKVNPKSQYDFALLFNELDSWRQQEVTRIKVQIFVLYNLSYCL